MGQGNGAFPRLAHLVQGDRGQTGRDGIQTRKRGGGGPIVPPMATTWNREKPLDGLVFNTPGAGIADVQATGAADVTGAVGPGSTPAPVTLAADNKDPIAASRCATGPDRLRNSLTRSGKEDVGRGMEPPATAGAGSIVDPELPRSREATTASSRSRRLCPGRQLLFPDRERSEERGERSRDR